MLSSVTNYGTKQQSGTFFWAEKNRFLWESDGTSLRVTIKRQDNH